jgi:predicted nucleic acid-binding protein
VIVVDASAWARSIVGDTPLSKACAAVLESDPEWVVANHCKLEVLRTLKRFEYVGEIDAADATRIAEIVIESATEWYGTETRWVLDTAWRLRHNVSTCDAAYVAIALRFNIPLVTIDNRLATAARAVGATVIVPEAAVEESTN